MASRIVSTPWGFADYQREIAPGIVFYTTPSHGGIHLSPERQAVLASKLPTFKPFAGAPWYEEDCDYAVVAVVFPEYFQADTVKNARKQIKAMASWGQGERYRVVARWLDPSEQLPAVRFSEAECSGSFDGFSVTSDADPGL